MEKNHCFENTAYALDQSLWDTVQSQEKHMCLFGLTPVDSDIFAQSGQFPASPRSYDTMPVCTQQEFDEVLPVFWLLESHHIPFEWLLGV